MAGNKNSGRRKGSVSKSKNQKPFLKLKKEMQKKWNYKTPGKIKKMQVVENTEELKSSESQKITEPIEIFEFEPTPMEKENDNFDALGKSLAAETEAALAAENEKNKVAAPAPVAEPEKSPEADPQPAAIKESWKPVAAVGYQIIGELLETNTGIKELNYSEDEIELLAAETEKIIHVLWPNATGGLTEDQKTLLFSGFIILSVHNKKYQFYRNKKSELNESRNT